MADTVLQDYYQRLDLKSRVILQICALSDSNVKPDQVVQLTKQAGWKDGRGKSLLKTDAQKVMKALQKRNLLSTNYYSGFRINPAIQDIAVQDSIRRDSFETLADLVVDQVKISYGNGNGDDRDLRIAFYRNEVARCQQLLKQRRQQTPPPLLEPFDRQIYDTLDPTLQQLYFRNAVPKFISQPDDSKEALAAFRESIAATPPDDTDLQAAWLDLAFASGDIPLMKQLDQATNQKLPEVAGLLAVLQGDFDHAESCLVQIMPGGKQRSKLAATGHLPAIAYLLLLFRHHSADAIKSARAVIGAAARAKKGHFADLMDVFQQAVKFWETPSSAKDFIASLPSGISEPLKTLLSGYFAKWVSPDAASGSTGLVAIANAFRKAGLLWLAAEADGLVGVSGVKAAKTRALKSTDTHQKLGTHSLINMVEAEPAWQRSLNAIAGLAGGESQTTSKSTVPQVDERLIWELNPRNRGIDLEVYQQKLTGNKWSKGRKVSLERLHSEIGRVKFAFVTEQDRLLIKAMEVDSYRNHYGYSETCCSFDNLRAARALIGHPCVFPPKNRETPFEIVEQQPQLTVVKDKKKGITIKLEPAPHTTTGDEFSSDYLVQKDGPRRIAIVFFNERHQQLHRVLGKSLSVPAEAADKVMAAIQPVTSLVSVHSEIGVSSANGETLHAAETVQADTRPHIHLLPDQDGLRAEFFVRPFGTDGPFCRPGIGAENLFASIDGKSQTTARLLTKERQYMDAVLNACPAMAAYVVEDGAVALPTPVEALETLLQLEELVTSKTIELHWPQGRSLTLAGQADEAQFKINIRKDRDWFAASGSLNVDKSLAIDLMDLLEMVDASPSRFVKLSDGRFLALTQQLRQRIEDFAAYGDRRSSKGKLRFPPVRAAVLEDLSDTVSVKSDKHWKDWVGRMRNAGDVQADIPTTLQLELRDYQLEGFRWLVRLATWGVGGCLADDMGLGKTIQALALLLHRSADGPALVVAPTSVAFNWVNEIQKFAPTLNVHLFGSGDRATMLSELGPRDVVICSYGLLHTEAELLQSQTWHTVILDEAQAIKNMATQRSKAAMGLVADFRLIMTGTPLENHLGELWNLMEFINPGLLGSADSFQKRFAIPIERDACRETRRRLKKLVQPFILRRTKSQVLQDLPSRTEVTLQVQLSDEEAALYEALRMRAVEQLADVGDGKAQHLKILAALMKLRRACCHPSLAFDGCKLAGSKLSLFSETLDELLKNNHKVLVFSQFVDHLTILRNELDSKQIAYQYLDGSTPAKKRKASVEAFQSGEGDVFLISLKAGGLGLNLTAADYVIHMDPWWNPAVEDQASDRAHRMGQQRPVTIYRLITQGTIEQKITELHASKRDLADSLLEGTDVSGKMSAEELLKLIRE